MLLIGSRLLHTPVMSLQTGTKLATTAKPIIDPANLHIMAYELEGDLLTVHPSFLRTLDIREYGRLGMIVNSSDEFVELDDIIKLKQIYELQFSLIGLTVVDEHKRKLGKVDDYTVETGDFFIQQLNVRRGILKGITDTGLLIHRSQIIEINNSTIVVKSADAKTATPVMQSIRSEFTNPFRGTTPQATPNSIQTQQNP